MPELLPELPSLSTEPACNPGRAMGDTRCCCHAGAAKALPPPGGAAGCPCRLPRLRLPRCPALLVVPSLRLQSNTTILCCDWLHMNRPEADQAGPMLMMEQISLTKLMCHDPALQGPDAACQCEASQSRVLLT